eukprot:scaffold113761_cov51-Phaeocystis_antarctica.AAC.1
MALLRGAAPAKGGGTPRSVLAAGISLLGGRERRDGSMRYAFATGSPGFSRRARVKYSRLAPESSTGPGPGCSFTGRQQLRRYKVGGGALNGDEVSRAEAGRPGPARDAGDGLVRPRAAVPAQGRRQVLRAEDPQEDGGALPQAGAAAACRMPHTPRRASPRCPSL